jgi:hypothetical protein
MLMAAFKISNALMQLKDTYPDKESFLYALKNCTTQEQFGIIRLWLTEGIPYAFRDNPFLYETVRDKLVEIFRIRSNVTIHAKEITLIGSGRIGYSLAPAPKYGKLFNEDSDLDFSIISDTLFLKCKEAFELWLSDYLNHDTILDGKENKYWASNANNVPKNIDIGFIDANKIPRLDKYKIAVDIGRAEDIISLRLKGTYKPPLTFKISISVYKNWVAFFNRRFKNINALINKN